MLRRKAIVIIAAAISLAAIPAAANAATAAPASTNKVCTTFGNGLCLGASTVANGNPVVLTATGRDIIVKKQGFTWEQASVLRLEFSQDTSQCVGVSNDGSNVVIRDCSNGKQSNVNWVEAADPHGGTDFVNTNLTDIVGHGGVYLFSDNHQGDSANVGVRTSPPCSGCLYSWNPPPATPATVRSAVTG